MRLSILIATYGDEEWSDRAAHLYMSKKHVANEVLLNHEPEGTISEVRNVLGREASCEWLCFLDADDDLGPGYVQAMERALEQERGGPDCSPGEHPPLLLTPAVQQVHKGRPRRPAFYPEVPLDQANWLIVGTLIERDLFLRVGGFGDYPHGFEDWSLWAKAHKMGARVVKVPDAVYIQNINPQSKHRQGWRNRPWQVATHKRVQAELEAWTP